jgi:hypothetical protein
MVNPSFGRWCSNALKKGDKPYLIRLDTNLFSIFVRPLYSRQYSFTKGLDFSLQGLDPIFLSLVYEKEFHRKCQISLWNLWLKRDDGFRLSAF